MKPEQEPREPGKRSAGRRWARLLAFLLFLVLVLEVGLRVLFWFTIDALQAPYGCGGPVALSEMSFIYHEIKGQSLFQSGMIQHDESRGYKLATNLRDYVVDEESNSFVNTNSDGFRGIAEYDLQPPDGVLRIIALGDSFTFGEGVGDQETWPAQLQEILDDTEVLNLGVFAYSHDQALLALRDDGLRYKPGVVILGYVGMDLDRNVTPFFCFAKAVPDPGSPEGFSGIPVSTPADLKGWIWTRSFILESIRMAWQTITFEPPRDDHKETIGGHVLDDLRALTEAAGARLIIIDIPGRGDTEVFEGSFIQRYVRKTGVEFLDPRPRFQAVLSDQGEAAYDALYLPNNDHTGASGYRIIAEELKRYLEDNPAGPEHQPAT